MEIQIRIGETQSVNREVMVRIRAAELRSVSLNVAFAEQRNRTGHYMRRHPKPDDPGGQPVGPNAPLRSRSEPPKLVIKDHLKDLGAPQLQWVREDRHDHGDREAFGTQRAMLVVPVSDLVANLMRPCFSVRGFGRHRAFFFEDEPIERKTYWSLCCFSTPGKPAGLRLLEVRYDLERDTVRSLDGTDLASDGLEWAVTLVPLVKDSQPVSCLDIARNDYDLRQIFGRQADRDLLAVYETWFEGWEDSVEQLVREHLGKGRPFEVFYHSVLGIKRVGGTEEVVVLQRDGDLPGLAQDLAGQGFVSAGLLDSGGSCALYDPWLRGYLNHGWYFREPRGAVMLFELSASERVPEPRPGCWFQPGAV